MTMSRHWRFRIEDILDCIGKIRRYVADMDFDSFRANDLVLDAALRNIEVIGEAARSIPPEVRSRFPIIPWAEMVAMRNVVAHEYPGIDTLVVWKTICEDLPPLEPLLHRVLSDSTD